MKISMLSCYDGSVRSQVVYRAIVKTIYLEDANHRARRPYLKITFLYI